jgi:CheY-like chemotaxis protein
MHMARILVIDDDADVRAALGQMLKFAGHEVVLATDGKEGVKQYRAAPADLVIVDLLMPNQEGLETIRELRRDFPKVAIIAISGMTAASTMLSIAQRLGAVAVIEKPFFPDQLLSVMGKVLPLKS